MTTTMIRKANSWANWPASKHETFTQGWFNIGPPSMTLVQHWTSLAGQPSSHAAIIYQCRQQRWRNPDAAAQLTETKNATVAEQFDRQCVGRAGSKWHQCKQCKSQWHPFKSVWYLCDSTELFCVQLMYFLSRIALIYCHIAKEGMSQLNRCASVSLVQDMSRWMYLK